MLLGLDLPLADVGVVHLALAALAQPPPAYIRKHSLCAKRATIV
jgi:hypothetical protein